MLARLGAPLNLKYCMSADPVNTNRFESARLTEISTFAPFWVTVTVPNGGVPQPPVQWSDVIGKVTARAPPGTAIVARSNANAPPSNGESADLMERLPRKCVLVPADLAFEGGSSNIFWT